MDAERPVQCEVCEAIFVNEIGCSAAIVLPPKTPKPGIDLLPHIRGFFGSHFEGQTWRFRGAVPEAYVGKTTVCDDYFMKLIERGSITELWR